MSRKLVPGQEYSFTMVISPRGRSGEKVDELNGGFIPERGDTPDGVREGIIAQYLKENRHVRARDMLVLSFNYS